MQNLTPYRVIRAAILTGLAALTLSTHTFVSIDRVRAKVLEVSTAPTGGRVRVTSAGFPQVNDLKPPFALIARIKTDSGGVSAFTVAVDGRPVCEPSVVGGGARRVDCAVAGAWTQAGEHEVVVQSVTSTGWTLEYLELATHHGNTDGFDYLVILPALSDHYVRPGVVWVIAASLLLFAAIVLLPAAASMPRWVRLLYGFVVGVVVLELVVSQISQMVSDYHVVLSAGTFGRLLALLLLPRLWVAVRDLVRPGVDLIRSPGGRLAVGLVVALVLLYVGGATAWEFSLRERWNQYLVERRAEQARAALLAELQPVKLANCEFQRFGEANDGGYILCANLLGAVQSAYSYGISGYDQWGCDVTHKFNVPVHEYDCFNLTVPSCPGGKTVFHGECVAGKTYTEEGRPFDTPENQFAKNGDAGKQVVMKMDVEGAEWDTLLRASDEVLQKIDQLTIEMHGVEEPPRFTEVVVKLKRFFYVANLHMNNFSCAEGVAPFPALVYEVLFVSKRLGVLGGSGPAGAPKAMMTPNIPLWKDCQSMADLPPVRPPAPTK